MLAAGIGLIVILLAATAIVLAVLRKDALDSAESHLGNLATVLAAHSWQSVRAVEVLGKATADDLQDRIAGKRPLLDRELAARFEERVRSLRDARMLAFIDPAGSVVLHSPAVETAGVNFSDREHFRVHLDRRLEGLHVGSPVRGRLMPEWVNVFSCRVEDGRGALRGVVFLAVAPAYFVRLFESVELGGSGRVLLFRDDGVLLASHPVVEQAYGQSFAGDPLFTTALPAAPSGAQRRAGLFDSLPRIVAHRRLEGYPLVVAVSATEDFFLAPWRRDAWRIGAGALAAAAFIGMALFYLLRQQRISAGLAHDLLEAGQRLSGIVHSAMDAIITIDDTQRIVLFNEAAEEIFGCPAREAIGSALDRFIPGRFRAVHGRHVEEFGRTGTTARRMGTKLELSGLRTSGEEFPIDASISQIATGGKKYYTVILRDITRRKRAEEALARSYDELRELSATMNEVREAERTRIARELHDELAQWLTALRMDVSWLASRLPREHQLLLERTEKMKGVVDTTVSAVRRIAADLRPVMLDDLGLVPAIEGLLHDLSQRTGIVVSLEPDHGSLAPGDPVATAVYRMVQEALTNVARHAEATEVRVTMNREGEMLVIRVRDNGKGYDAEAAERRKSYGVLGIRERAYTLGGSARIVRPMGGGTLVEIEIPMARFKDRGTAGDTRTAG